MNKKLRSTTNSFSTYGFFPRDVMNIIISYVLYNYIDAFIISNDALKESLNTITIPYIKRINTALSENKNPYHNDNEFKRKRKFEIIQDVVYQLSEKQKKIRIMNNICTYMPKIIGYVKCIENDVERHCDILNPKIKPFIIIGRIWQAVHNYKSQFDIVDLNCSNFINGKKISRNHMKISYNPLSKKLQVRFIGRNAPILNNKSLDFDQLIELNNNDELVQPNTDMKFIFHLN